MRIDPDPAFFLIADPDPYWDLDPDTVPGFDDQKLKKFSAGNLYIYIFFGQQLQFTFP
jgi:hypothetical protein